MKIESLAQLNAEIRAGRTEHLFLLSEAYQDMMIVNIVNSIQKSGRKIVLIAGPSSSGKTSTAKKVCVHLEAAGTEALYLGTDDYFIDKKLIPYNADGEQNFENFSVVDLELFRIQLKQLLAGETVDLPKYDFRLGKKIFGKRKMKMLPGQLLVIEGIHALNDALTPDIAREDKFKIFISPMSSADPSVDPSDVRKLRRIIRDNAKRGWDARETLRRWSEVIAGEAVNIFPYKDDADIAFDTAYVYEPAVLKKYAYPLLLDIPCDNPHYDEAKRLLAILDKYIGIDDDSRIEADSIIREFIGGGVLK